MVKVKSVEKSNKLPSKILPDTGIKTKLKSSKNKLQRRKPLKEEKKGVVYLSHIPHGFYEKEIHDYFGQFGKVTAVSLPRSKSGKSKGYAFIEFLHPEVAEIAAEAMNNYLMFNRLVKAKYLSPEEQKPHLLFWAKKAQKAHTTVPENAEKKIEENRTLKNRQLPISLEAKKARQLIKRNDAMKRKLKSLGVEYEFEVEEGNLESVFEKRREMLKIEKKRLQEEVANQNNEESSEDEEDLSSIEGEINLSDEDQVMDFLSEEEETKEDLPESQTKTIKSNKGDNKTKKLKQQQNQKQAKPTKRKSSLVPAISSQNNLLSPVSSSSKKMKLTNTDKGKTLTKKERKTELNSLSKNTNSLIQQLIAEEKKALEANSLSKSTNSLIQQLIAEEKNALEAKAQNHKKLQTQKSKNGLTSKPVNQKPGSIQKGVQALKDKSLSKKKSKESKVPLSSTPFIQKEVQSSLLVEGKLLKPKPRNSGKLQKSKKVLPSDSFNENVTQAAAKLFKHKSKNSVQAVKSNKISSLGKTKSKKVKTPVLIVDKDDVEVDFKTPPNVTKKFLKSETDPAKMGLKENNKSGLNTVLKRKPRHRTLSKSQ